MPGLCAWVVRLDCTAVLYRVDMKPACMALGQCWMLGVGVG
jgi:hypothetical protein